MWYAYEGEWMNWHKLTTDQVKEIISLNKKQKKAISLEEYASDLIQDNQIQFENVVGQDSLTRFDRPKARQGRTNKRKKRKKRPQNNAE